ncbi:MAG: amino acid permease [Gammaproteobacteria bacterium]|nr:amino acid permease [Gammaproteobacteria bacterium]
MSNKIGLKRTLSLPQLVLYGLGTTIGAGIYALVGELAGIAGYFSPISFLIASLIATVTAISFAELSSRFPRAAGTAVYVKEGFGSKNYSTLTGILVSIAGLVSAAALVNGFVGYLQQFIQLDTWFIITLITLFLGGVAACGINVSASLAGLITIIEVGGLIFIITISHGALAELPTRWPEIIPPLSLSHWENIFIGSILAFYAFIGFEDMVVVAEEVKDVKRNLPLAIMLTLGITTILYMLIMVTAVLALPPADLASSNAPLSYLYHYFTGDKTTIISIIGLLAIINGALIQMIMASRVMYGLSSHGQLPVWLSFVHPRTQTPLFSTLIATITVLILALIGHLSILAEVCSVIMLIIFSLVNLALIRVKRRDPHPENTIVFPTWIPMTGFVISVSFVLITLINVLLSG